MSGGVTICAMQLCLFEDGTMSEIVVQIDLEKTSERAIFERGYRKVSEVRIYSLQAIVDSVAAILVLPQNEVGNLR